MGWWDTDAGVWGDTPADAMGYALEQIIECFHSEWGREPTLEEIVEGVKISYF